VNLRFDHGWRARGTRLPAWNSVADDQQSHLNVQHQIGDRGEAEQVRVFSELLVGMANKLGKLSDDRQ
jgi:hypothetical protein